MAVDQYERIGGREKGPMKIREIRDYTHEKKMEVGPIMRFWKVGERRYKQQG